MHTVTKKVRKKAKEKPFIPDEIIRNILIRLPVKSVVRFEIVCRKWRDMILTRDFVDLHQRSSIPLVLVGTRSYYLAEFFAVDKWWDLSRRRSMLYRFPFCAADFPYAFVDVFSHAGLIVLRGSRFVDGTPKFIILNLARPSDERVKINYSRYFRGVICAVYYHPSLKEYCSLWKIDKSGHPEPIQYKLLNLGSNPSFKTICNSFDYRVKDEDAYPLFINNHLYWMLKSEQEDKFGGRNDILGFDIISEEFKVIPCPIPLNTMCKKHQTHLLNIDGILSFLLVLPNTVTLWRLQDHVLHLWTTTEYTLSIEICHDFDALDIIAFVDGKLAFKLGGRLSICNLMDRTVKKYPKKKYNGDVCLLSHHTSLASLKNCTPALYIDEDGMVKWRQKFR